MPGMRWSIWRAGRDGAPAAATPARQDEPGQDRPEALEDSVPAAGPAPAGPIPTSGPLLSPARPPSTSRHLALPTAASPELTAHVGADLVPADLLPPGPGVPGPVAVPGGTVPGGTGAIGLEVDPGATDPGLDVPGPDPSLLLLAVCDPRIPAELRDLRQRMPGIEATLVATVDGVVLAHDPAGRDLHEAGRVALALLTQGRQATVTLGRGRFRNSVIWGTDGYLAVYAVGQEALLLVQASKEARVGRLHVEARSSSAAIAALLA